MSKIETYSGLYIDLKNPQKAQISLEDVAHALSNIGRFTGHCQRFYSVAEHALLTAEYLLENGFSKRIALQALHHDSSEAYLGDVSRPLKALLEPEYKILENRMTEAIFEAFDIPLPTEFEQRFIKQVDDWALCVEAWFLLKSKGMGWETDRLYVPSLDDNVKGIGRLSVPQSPSLIKEEFLEMHLKLSPTLV